MNDRFTFAQFSPGQRARLEFLIPYLDIQGLREAQVLIDGGGTSSPEFFLDHLLKEHAQKPVKWRQL